MATYITQINISKVESSPYINVFRVNFLRDGKKLSWDCAKIHDSVSVLLYNSDKDSFLLVKQIRIPFLYRQIKDGFLPEDEELGYTYELCSGLMDKGLSEVETVKEEILEETGYKVDEVLKIASFYGALGVSASKQTFFYARISDDMKVGNGGGIDDEKIELFYLPKDKAEEFIFDKSYVKPASLAYCLMWWFEKFKKQNIQ